MLFAGLTGIYTPQIFSIQSHYGLAYSCLIPMIFYWTIQYNLSAKWKYPVYVFILAFIASFLHPYYSAQVLVFVGSYVLGYFIFARRPFRQMFLHVLPMLVSVGVLMGSIGIIMKLTDPVTDRPTTPYGMLVYRTRGTQILTSDFSPFWQIAKKQVPFLHVSTGGEGYCYPGIVITMVVLVSVFSGIVSRFRKKEGGDLVTPTRYNPVWLFIAVLSLLFAMGVPFIWHMEWLVDYVSVFRQFRTLGRFSWIFYYLISVYGVVVINNWFSKLLLQKKQALAYVVLIGALCTWSIEAGGYILFERASLANYAENYKVVTGDKGHDWVQFLDEHHYRPGDFQALLILRFFEVGMDKLWLDRDVTQKGVASGLEAGIQLHLPWVDIMMARTSWAQTEKQVKIAGGPYVRKPLLDDIKSNKPFLLLHVDSEPLEPDQQYLLTASQYVGHYRGCFVYACYPDRLRALDQKNRDTINLTLPYLTTGDTCIRNTGSWYVNHFDSGAATARLFGTGAVPQFGHADTVIAKVQVSQHGDDQMYEFSCWFLLGDENYKSPDLKIELLKSDGEQVSIYDARTRESTDNHGLWFRTYSFFPVPANCTTIRCRLLKDPENSFKAMDELMIRPANSVIVSKAADGSAMVNNHLFQK
jgi:hypothetical protein